MEQPEQADPPRQMWTVKEVKDQADYMAGVVMDIGGKVGAPPLAYYLAAMMIMDHALVDLVIAKQYRTAGEFLVMALESGQRTLQEIHQLAEADGGAQEKAE
jgi:xylose isomerase